MKIRAAVALTVALVVLAIGEPGPPAIAGTTPSEVLGDSDCSQAIDLGDATSILRHVAQVAPAPCSRSADTQCDGDVDAIDALQILMSSVGLTVSQEQDCPAIGDPLPDVQTSEQLIAAALTAGDISFEDSLRYRAFALYNDPRLPEDYQSPIIDMEAADDLFGEVDQVEDQLSANLLADLAPFRARPNDPVSIFNAPAAGAVSAQGLGWIGESVPGTNVRVWIKGTTAQLQSYKPLISQVWGAFPGIFPYPMADTAGVPSPDVNPDGAIDFYIVRVADIDPRHTQCEATPDYVWWCRISANNGFAQRAAPDANRKSSGYLLMNISRTGNDFIDTAAHELTHVAQFSFDNDDTSWLKESTATWSEYRILKKLGIRPNYPYDRLPPVFSTLGSPLTRESGDDLHAYGSWLFFYHASIDLGDGIVTSVWEKAGAGLDGIDAVNAAIPLEDNFPLYAVRNWNQDGVEVRYRDRDGSFPLGLEPDPIEVINVPLTSTHVIEKGVKNLAAVYYHYKFGPEVKRVTFQNLVKGVPGIHIWAIPEIDGEWGPPEDWTGIEQKVYCRNSQEFPEDITDLVIIVSNSRTIDPVPAYPQARILAEGNGCVGVEGWAETTVHLLGGGTDITYTSGRVPLRFIPRQVQEVPGNVQYDLAPGSMTWTVSGTDAGCTLDGQVIINFTGEEYNPATSMAAGYLNVVGLDGGDFHSTIVIAHSLEPAIKKTCPGDPPRVTYEGLRVGYLLLIISQPNTHILGPSYRGDQTLDFGGIHHFTWDLQPMPP